MNRIALSEHANKGAQQELIVNGNESEQPLIMIYRLFILPPIVNERVILK